MLFRALLAWTLLASAALADERIVAFDETVTVQPDGSLEVREAIRVRVEGQKIRRGILRDFPTTYSDGNGRQVVVGFRFESAIRDGQEEPWRTEQHGNGVRVYLGNPNVMLPHGEHVYEIVYRTDRQMGFFADHDELFWNVTGNGWDFPIDRATARLVLPASIPVNDVRMEAYTGAQGERGKNYTATIDNGAPLFATTRALRPHEGLTIVAMWPKGYITAPVEESVPAAAASSSAGYPIADSGNRTYYPSDMPKTTVPAFLAVGGLALLLFYYYRIWLKVGVDPPSRITIPEYEMPAGQSPASMRYLIHRSYDDGCLASAVLSLAVKGHLRIEQESGPLGLGKTTSLIPEKRTDAKPLSADETELLRVLFSRGGTLVLKDENHDRVREAETMHGHALEDRYKSGFFNINGGWHFLGVVLSLVLALPAIIGPSTDVWPAWHFLMPAGWFTMFIVLLMLLTNGVFGKLLQAPTVAGQKVMDHIRGFKMYLEVAEGEALKQVKQPPPLTPQLFESYLPAALALGVEQKWAERFRDVLSAAGTDYSPAWYAGPAWNVHSVSGFTSGLGSSLSTAISSSSTPPGSHSGGGGGGSSGGGGGGGGGGGW